ncbi:dihydrofolate reductase family protein [Paenibacillus sp. IHBB 10380]|uniref:dihydrofolate reductase family protein n=1 Tax=Paenibacillus sp. IHBB 10380 TaxID=1566358 RepID=UPI0009E4E680|nr:dihydrofolate reductase family protein [Paenibacillus sp. IHBB 10380]
MGELDLIDEYRLMVFPVVLGSGKRLFGDGIGKVLRLADTKIFSSGVVVHTYHPAKD